MIYGCQACTNNCSIPGKHRGTRIRNWACPCGGALGKGRNADGASVFAVPLKLEEQGVPEDRLGLKRSTAQPRTRGAAPVQLVVVLAVLGPLALFVFVYLGIHLYRRWLLDRTHRVICDHCGRLIEDGIDPVAFGRCLACRYAVRGGIA